MSLNWVATTILSAMVFSINNVIDSHLISRRFPTFRTYLLPVGVMMLAWSIILVSLFPLPWDVGWRPMLAASTAGILRSTAVIIMLYTMKREEVSRVIPIVNIYPVFVALMAMPLLGEMLNSRQWLAIIIVVVGVALLSLKRGSRGRLTSVGRTLLLLIGSSLIMATGDIAAKYALAYYSSWNMYSITHFALSGMFLAVALRTDVLRELNSLKGRNFSLSIVFFNEIAGVIAMVLFYLAMQAGPVSLVTTVFSSRLLFVFLLALVISRFSPVLLEWNTEKTMLLVRFIAVSLIIYGVAIIYLT